MSDRSGVGAPTHDGAEPESSGSGDPADATVDAAVPSSRQSARRARTATEGSEEARPKRRLGAGLLGAALGTEPADPTATPPGVPGGLDRQEEPSAADEADAPATGASATTTPAETSSASRSTAEKADAARLAPETAPATSSHATVAAAPHAVVSTTVDRPLPAVDLEPSPVVVDGSWPVDVAAAEKERPGRRRGGLRARQVHRIIRRVDPWSVLKLSLLFFFCVWLMVVISGVLIWGVAVGSGTVESLEEFIAKLLAFEEFHFNADQIFRLFAIGGLIMVFLGTAIAAILAVLFNLISDLIGGIRITVIEEETTRRIVRRS